MGKNRSASGITNVIQYDNNGNITFVSGSTTLMQVSSSGAITTTGVISGSNALSASFSLNSALLNGTGSVGFATTASLLTVSSSQQQISASLLQVSASYISLSGSYNVFSGSNSTILTAVSSSQQQISASLLNVISIFATTGSNSFRATQSITGSLTVTGQIIAQTLNVQQVTSSIVYSSGSNNFGCDLNSRQTFTGSVLITGSLTIAGASSATSYSGATIFGSTIACSPIGCFATSCATSFIGGTMSGTTIYGSTAVCSPVGKFTTCLDLGGALTGTSATFSNSGATLPMTIFNTAAGDSRQLRLGYNDTFYWEIGRNDTLGGLEFKVKDNLIGPISRVIFGYNGNVGIGTNCPAQILHISATTPTLFLSDCAATGNGGNVYITAAKSGVGYNNLTMTAYTYNFKGGGSETSYFSINSAGVACFAGAVCAQQLIGISSATVNGPIYFQNGGNTYFQQYVGSSCDLVIYNTTNNGMYVYTNSAQRFGIAGNGSAIFACQLCVKSLVTTNGNISQVQNSVRTQTFFAYKFINENSTANFFRITTSGASSTHTQLVASNAGVGWHTSQIYNAGNSSYWGGYIGSGTQVSIAGGSAGYISGVYSDNAGAQNYCVTVANNGTSTQSLVVAYITVTAADGYTIQFTQL